MRIYFGHQTRVWKMFFDGAVNQYGNGIGVLLITPNRSHVPLAVNRTLRQLMTWQNMKLVSPEWKIFGS